MNFLTDTRLLFLLVITVIDYASGGNQFAFNATSGCGCRGGVQIANFSDSLTKATAGAATAGNPPNACFASYPNATAVDPFDTFINENVMGHDGTFKVLSLAADGDGDKDETSPKKHTAETRSVTSIAPPTPDIDTSTPTEGGGIVRSTRSEHPAIFSKRSGWPEPARADTSSSTTSTIPEGGGAKSATSFGIGKAVGTNNKATCMAAFFYRDVIHESYFRSPPSGRPELAVIYGSYFRSPPSGRPELARFDTKSATSFGIGKAVGTNNKATCMAASFYRDVIYESYFRSPPSGRPELARFDTRSTATSTIPEGGGTKSATSFGKAVGTNNKATCMAASFYRDVIYESYFRSPPSGRPELARFDSSSTATSTIPEGGGTKSATSFGIGKAVGTNNKATCMAASFYRDVIYESYFRSPPSGRPELARFDTRSTATSTIPEGTTMSTTPTTKKTFNGGVSEAHVVGNNPSVKTGTSTLKGAPKIADAVSAGKVFETLKTNLADGVDWFNGTVLIDPFLLLLAQIADAVSAGKVFETLKTNLADGVDWFNGTVLIDPFLLLLVLVLGLLVVLLFCVVVSNYK